MTNIIVLFIIYLILFGVSYIFSQGKIATPSVVFCLSWLVMLAISIICYDYFDFHIQAKTCYILIIASAIFVIVEGLSRNFFMRNIKKSVNMNLEPIVIEKAMLNALLVVSILIFIAMIGMIYINTSGSIPARMKEYKKMKGIGGSGVRFRTICSQLYKLDLGIAHIVGYITVYNKTINQKSKIPLKQVLIIVIYMVTAFFSEAARQPVIEMVIFLALVYVILLQKNKKMKRIIKFVIKMIPFVLILAFGFYYSMTFAGRTLHAGKTVLHYVAEYLCGGLYSFNLHIDEPARSAYFGRTTFGELYLFFAKIKLLDPSLIIQHNFDKYGNTNTIFGRWYEDFGVIGVFIMVMIVALFFGRLYAKTTYYTTDTSRYHWQNILYAFLVIALVWAAYDDRIKAMITTTMALKVFCMYLIYSLLIKKCIRVKW